MPVRVIVLDDHDVVRTGLATLLAQHGFEVVADTHDVAEAVLLVQAKEVDLAIVDVRLGGVSGAAAVQRLRHARPGLRVCMLTSFADPKAARVATQNGATGFVLKDQPAEDLVRHLQLVAEGSTVIDQRVAGEVLNPADPILTEKELAVLSRIADGMTNREVGAELGLSHHTVKEYLSNAMRKLETRTRAETVAIAIRQGLLDPAEEQL